MISFAGDRKENNFWVVKDLLFCIGDKRKIIKNSLQKVQNGLDVDFSHYFGMNI